MALGRGSCQPHLAQPDRSQETALKHQHDCEGWENVPDPKDHGKF